LLEFYLQATARENLKSSDPKGSPLRAGGRGVWGEFRPPYKFWAKSVRIFSKAHRQLENAAFCTITRQHSPKPSVLVIAKIAKALSVNIEDIIK